MLSNEVYLSIYKINQIPSNCKIGSNIDVRLNHNFQWNVRYVKSMIFTIFRF